MPERWRRLRGVVERALELGPAARARWLDEACADDAALRGEAEEWLGAAERAGRFLEPPASPARPVDPGARVGPFRIRHVVASGGMGTVYEAEQETPRRRVALKMMRAGLAGPDAARRFRYEVEVLAALRHPGIAQVYETGVHGDRGRELPWFAMEFVPEARTIREHAAGLSRGERVRLFAAVCDAVQHGHARGVIHRDLKPDNILVDAAGRPKVIDFGVARATGARFDARTLRTQTGEILGTVSYMSPEQIAGDAALDTRSDVYALGVVLYELLLGQLPYALGGTGWIETARAIRETAPNRPGRLDPALRGDLETILLNCLEKDPARRYGSAGGLADDLRRFLDRRPIAARSPSTLYQLTMLARRHKAVAGALVLALASLVAGAVVSLRFALDAAEARVVAEAERREALWQAYVARIAAADAALTVHHVGDARHHLLSAPESLRAFEWHHLLHRLDDSEETLAWDDHHVLALASDTRGGRFACAGLRVPGAAAVRLWDAGSREVVRELRPPGGPVRSIAFSPRGDLLALGSSGGDVQLCATETGAVVRALDGHARSVRCLAFDAEGARLVSGAADGDVALWDVATGDRLAGFALAGPVVCVAFRDGAAAVAGDGTVRVGEKTFHAGGSVTAAAFGPGVVAYAVAGAVVHVRPLGAAGAPVVLAGHAAPVRSVRFDPDGERLVTASHDFTVRIWDVARAQCVSVLRGHVNAPMTALFLPGADRVASCSGAGGVRIWTAVPRDEVPTLRGHADHVHDLAFHPDSKRLATGARDGTVKVWDVPGRRELRTLAGPGGPLWGVAFDPSGGHLAAVGDKGLLVLWETAAWGRTAAVDAGQGRLRGVRFAPGGARLYTAGEDGTVKVWDPPGCAHVTTFKLHERALASLALSPDGGTGAAGLDDDGTVLWDVRTGRVLHVLAGDPVSVLPSVSFSPDGTLLAASGPRRSVRLVETATGRVLRELEQQCAGPFTSDGRRLACGIGSLVMLWDPASGREVVTLRGHHQFLWRLVLSPDGKTLASLAHPLPGLGGPGNEIKLWETEAR